jgi:Bacterial cadherin-like domain
MVDTLMYSVVVSNGGTDAMNVDFTDQLNANLMLIGTANASPIGVNDTYASIGNVGISVPDGVSDLLANDVDPNGNAMTISGIVGCADATAPFVCTTANGGNITVQANGAWIKISLRKRNPIPWQSPQLCLLAQTRADVDLSRNLKQIGLMNLSPQSCRS